MDKDAAKAVKKLKPDMALPKLNMDNLKPMPPAFQNPTPEITRVLTGFWNLFLEPPEKIIPSWLKCLKLHFPVMDK